MTTLKFRSQRQLKIRSYFTLETFNRVTPKPHSVEKESKEEKVNVLARERGDVSNKVSFVGPTFSPGDFDFYAVDPKYLLQIPRKMNGLGLTNILSLPVLPLENLHGFY